MQNKILIDTCIWIDFFNDKNQKNNNELEQLLSDNRAVYCGVILSEILWGTASHREAEMISNYFKSMDYLELAEKDYFEIGLYASRLRLKGLNLPLSDIVISYSALKYQVKIFTKDKHFSLIQKHFPLKLF